MKATPLRLILFLATLSSTLAWEIPDHLTEAERKRFERLDGFQIKGVCGDQDLARLARLGVNTVRGYSIRDAASIRQKLDEAEALGLKMIVSEWMPHQGENKNKDGGVWQFDYHTKGDQLVQNFIKKVEGIGDHPAILMWGLGNEVHLDEPYLRTVNRMSEEIHRRFPHHLTSLTMINAKPEQIAAVKQFAPDLDVLGVQSYSLGAVKNSIKNAEEHWRKPFYVSEFNSKGPWNFPNSPWGVPLDEPATRKVNDLRGCYEAIDASPLCLGSTIFVWGHHTVYRPTYFSLLLDPNPQGSKDKSFEHKLVTPQAELMSEHFTGKPLEGNRAPVLSKLAFAEGKQSRLAEPGELMRVEFAATEPNDDPVEYVSWILDSTQRRTTVVAGPLAQSGPNHAEIPAPKNPGEYLLLVYAIDNKGGGSAGTLAFKVPTPMAESPTADGATPGSL